MAAFKKLIAVFVPDNYTVVIKWETSKQKYLELRTGVYSLLLMLDNRMTKMCAGGKINEIS